MDVIQSLVSHVNRGEDLEEIDADLAILIYGIAAAVQALLPTILYVSIADAVYRSTTKFLSQVFAAVWFPTFIAWIVTFFLDGEQVRTIFKYAVTISMGGPFFFNWVIWSDMLMTTAVNASWTAWVFWVLWGILLVYNVVIIWFQATIIPVVFRWVEEAKIVESVIEEAEEEEEVADDVEEEFFGW